MEKKIPIVQTGSGHTRKRLGDKKFHSLWFFPVILVGVFLAVSFAILGFIYSNINTSKEKQLIRNTETLAENMRLRFKGNQDYLILLAKERAEGALSASSFQEKASQYVSAHPEMINIAWVDSDSVIRDTAPFEANKQIVGLIVGLPEPKRASLLAMKTHQPEYTHPLEIIQGGTSFELWVPVYRNNDFLGFFSGVYSCEKILKELIPPYYLETNEVSLTDASGNIFATLEAKALANENLSHRVYLTDPKDGVFLQFNGFGSDVFEKSLLWLGLLCIAFIIGIVYSVIRLKQETEENREARRYSEKLIGSANAMIICLDTEGRVTDFNEAAENITGYSKDEVLGVDWFKLAIPRDRYPDAWKIFETFKEKGTRLIGNFENPILTKKGEERIIEWRNSELFEGEHLTGTLSYGIDVTERNRAEERLRVQLLSSESLGLVNRAIQGTNDLDKMMRDVLDAVLSIFDCDRAWLLYPCDPETLTFRIPMERTKPEYPGALAKDMKVKNDRFNIEILKTALATDGPFVTDLTTIPPLSPDAVKFFQEKTQISMALYPKTGKPYLFGIHQCSHMRVWTNDEKKLFREIGLRLSDSLTSTLMYVQLKENEQRLKELDNLKDDFLSVTTHELKSPLLPIKSQSQLLLDGDYGELNEKQRTAVKMIWRNEEVLNILASEIFDIAKMKSNKLKLVLEDISVGEVVTDAVYDRKSQADKKHLSFSLLLRSEIPKIRADEIRIRQVVSNLLDNAIKFTPENGTISVEIKKEEGNIMVSVKDSGIGLSKDNKEKIFTPFFQVESDITKKQQGAGLGLAIVKGIVEAHRGKVTVESEGEDRGSTFTFSLPIS